MNQRPAARIHAATQPADIDWVLTEPVDVTLVKQTSDGSETIVLVTRTVQAGAITLSFMDNGDILVNGVYRDLGDDMMEYCAITDELLMGPLPTAGDTVRSYPDSDLQSPVADRWSGLRAGQPRIPAGLACGNTRKARTMDTIGEAYQILCAVTAHAARGALSQGLSPEDVAAELHSLADAIDGTADVAESMYAIPQVPRAAWESIGVDFSETE